MPARPRSRQPAGPPERPPGDELYEVLPREFVAARDALVRELRSSGDREAAGEVAGLRRPTPSVWALNQVARHEPADIETFLAAVAQLRRATEQALGGDATGVQPAQADERAAIDGVVRAATTYLERADVVASTTLVQRMTDTLRAAAGDDDVAASLRAGRLSTDLTAPTLGLEGFAMASPASGTRARTRGRAAKQVAPAHVGSAELERAARAAEVEATQLVADAVKARDDAVEADAFARRAQQAAGRAEARAEEAQRKADQARARADAAKKRTTRRS